MKIMNPKLWTNDLTTHYAHKPIDPQVGPRQRADDELLSILKGGI